jgi:hypothetical protein
LLGISALDGGFFHRTDSWKCQPRSSHPRGSGTLTSSTVCRIIRYTSGDFKRLCRDEFFNSCEWSAAEEKFFNESSQSAGSPPGHQLIEPLIVNEVSRLWSDNHQSGLQLDCRSFADPQRLISLLELPNLLSRIP